MKRLSIFFAAIVFLGQYGAQAQAGLKWKGQASLWANVNPGNSLPLWSGLRYIPQANFDFSTKGGSELGLEASANMYADGGIRFSDSLHTGAGLKPYRVWARYATDRFELRMGLQKINFGSAGMLRPLMWFDQVDPRDPLQLTDGVWAVLGRYYFLNNANIWLWALYGNEGPKTWETGPTSKGVPEFGGRIQFPVPLGEAGFSVHRRKTDHWVPTPVWSSLAMPETIVPDIPEHRMGIDAKWDVEVGLWFEGVWINKQHDLGTFTNQQLFVLGSDYTFGIGNGIHLAAEHLFFSFDKKPFAFQNRMHLSALTASYPIALLDQLSCILYYDWTGKHIYSFINWQHQFKHVTMYVMGFVNPDEFQLAQQQDTSSLFFGKGFQLMFVYHH